MTLRPLRRVRPRARSGAPASSACSTCGSGGSSTTTCSRTRTRSGATGACACRATSRRWCVTSSRVYSRSTKQPSARGRRRPAGATKARGPAAAAPPAKTGAYAFGQVRHAYGIDAAGHGRGAAPWRSSTRARACPRADRRVLARCFGLGAVRTRTLLTDGQAQPFGRGSFEPQEDLALVRGMAPGLRSVTFTQVWLAQQLWFLGPSQLLARSRLPDTFSMSYGVCETARARRGAGRSSRAGARLMDAVLARLGLAGVATFAAAPATPARPATASRSRASPGPPPRRSSPRSAAPGSWSAGTTCARARSCGTTCAGRPSDNGGGAGGGGFATTRRARPTRRGSAPRRGARCPTSPPTPRCSRAGRSTSAIWVPDGGTSAVVAAGRRRASPCSARASGPPAGRRSAPSTACSTRSAPRRRRLLHDVRRGRQRLHAQGAGAPRGPGYDLASGLGVPRFRDIALALGR